jgi:hypothetical protein
VNAAVRVNSIEARGRRTRGARVPGVEGAILGGRIGRPRRDEGSREEANGQGVEERAPDHHELSSGRVVWEGRGGATSGSNLHQRGDGMDEDFFSVAQPDSFDTIRVAVGQRVPPAVTEPSTTARNVVGGYLSLKRNVIKTNRLPSVTARASCRIEHEKTIAAPVSGL